MKGGEGVATFKVMRFNIRKSDYFQSVLSLVVVLVSGQSSVGQRQKQKGSNGQNNHRREKLNSHQIWN